MIRLRYYKIGNGLKLRGLIFSKSGIFSAGIFYKTRTCYIAGLLNNDKYIEQFKYETMKTAKTEIRKRLIKLGCYIKKEPKRLIK
jgi:hypothetical protein